MKPDELARIVHDALGDDEAGKEVFADLKAKMAGEKGVDWRARFPAPSRRQYDARRRTQAAARRGVKPK